MNYDYQTENEKTIAFVKNLSKSMRPEDAVLVDTLKENPHHASGEHYTFSSLIPAELREKLRPLTVELGRLDPTLLLSEPELYHLTVFWCSMENDVARLSELVKEAIQKEPLSFKLQGLFAAPFGISLKAYPLNNTFVTMRQKLYPTAGLTLPLNSDGSYHERAVSTWITLARYTQPPKEDLLAFINARLDVDFGIYTPADIGVYISHNKYLKDPKLIEIISNG